MALSRLSTYGDLLKKKNGLEEGCTRFMNFTGNISSHPVMVLGKTGAGKVTCWSLLNELGEGGASSGTFA